MVKDQHADNGATSSYDPSVFPPFAVTADVAVFTIRDRDLCVLLVRRGEEPFAGALALPGGFLREESGHQAALRELSEETGLSLDGGHIEQLGTYSDPGRDPRMRVVSIAYVALTPDLPEALAGSDAAAAQWVPVASVDAAALAFDHGQIFTDALERVRAKLEYTTLATRFVPEPFTLPQLRQVYACVWGYAPDLGNFRRKVLGTAGFVKLTGDTAAPSAAGGRPAHLFTRGPAATLNPPILRR